MSDAPTDFGDISRRLAGMIEILAVELLGEHPSSKTKREWRFGSKGGISVEVGGADRGLWHDFTADKGGDPIAMIAHYKQLDKPVNALEWGCKWLGIEFVPAGNGSAYSNGRDHASIGNGAAPGHEDDSDAARAAKRDKIIAATMHARGTPGARYIERRGIAADAIDLPCIGWNPRAWSGPEGDFGAIVFKATTATGATEAVHQVYLSADGQKAPLKPAKRTNGTINGSAVRFPGNVDTGRIILAEGAETALLVWQAMREDKWACLGVSNIGNAPIPEGAEVIIARDADKVGSQPDIAVLKAAQRLVERGCRVRIATPSSYANLKKTDFNDMLLREGPAEIAWAIDGAVAVKLADGQVDDEPAVVVHNAGAIDVTQIAPRQWLLGVTFCRKFISGLIAEGGGGKTATRYAQYLAATTGRKLTGEHVHVRCRVLIVCLEDDLDEVKRRIGAAMLHHGVTREELDGWLYYCTPKGFKLLQTDLRPARTTGDLNLELKKIIAKLAIDLVAIDPFVKSHGVEENDNNAIDQVCIMLAQLADEFNCAIDILHHARKGAAQPGEADRSRGASATVDAGRLMRTLTPATLHLP